MIKELVQFTNSLPPELKAVGLVPKEGLHILLSFETIDGEVRIAEPFKHEVFSKKSAELSPLLRNLANLAQVAWMVNTNKCFDLPAKGIHSVSPFCLAFKRESIAGGAKYRDARLKLPDRISGYFDKAIALLETEEEKQLALLFKNALNNEEKLNAYLSRIPEFTDLKDTGYIVFYLDLPLEYYVKPNARYFKEKLFNTEEHNVEVNGTIYGTSNFYNGYNSKKPFLIHQTASYGISGRITADEAKSLFEFQEIAGRKGFLPNPLPIFIYESESKKAVQLFKEAVLLGEGKLGYQKIIERLRDPIHEVGNYYLLFYQLGEIKDFDFVSAFKYSLGKEAGEPKRWIVRNLMELVENKAVKNDYYLDNVFDLQWGLFNIAIGDKFKKADNFFDEIRSENYKENDGGSNDRMLLAFRKYRRSIYDYIYKSRRESINGSVFKEIMLAGILDDLKNNREYKLKEKLNIFFSLNHYFDKTNINFKGFFMPDKLDQLISKTMLIADSQERVSIADDIEFAFISGQVISYLFTKSMSENTSHSLLEGFLQKSDVAQFKVEIARFFRKYLHALDKKEDTRFGRLMREIMGYESNTDLKKLLTFVLAGYFSRAFYFTKKNKEKIEP